MNFIFFTIIKKFLNLQLTTELILSWFPLTSLWSLSLSRSRSLFSLRRSLGDLLSSVNKKRDTNYLKIQQHFVRCFKIKCCILINFKIWSNYWNFDFMSQFTSISVIPVVSLSFSVSITVPISISFSIPCFSLSFLDTIFVVVTCLK